MARDPALMRKMILAPTPEFNEEPDQLADVQRAMEAVGAPGSVWGPR